MERSAQSSRELPTEINTENTALMNFDNKLKCLPSYLIELLKETGYYSESSLLSINKKDIKGIENFAREHLHLLVDKKYYIKYYGPLFFKKPEIFQILGGFKKRILELSQQLQKETEAETPNDGGGDGTNNRPINGEPELACIVQDQEMEEDKARSEATFRYTVKNVSKMKDSQLSPACYVRNLSWKIEVIPWSSQTQKRQLQRFLGLFLQCNVESESTSWSCYAVAELRLLSFKEGIEPFSRKIKHLFCSKENDWGFSHFMTLQDILDPDKGFIKDDSITFEVHVEADVPNGVWLVERLQEEKRLEQRRNERTEAYMTVNVFLEDSFNDHQGKDLYDPEHSLYHVFRVRKQATVHEFLELLSDNLTYPIEQIRIWPFEKRSNQTYRPTLIKSDADLQTPIICCAESHNPWDVFVELLPPNSNKDNDVLLFFKLYDPKNKKIRYCGHHLMPVVAKVQELIPILNERAGFPPDTKLALYEEITPNVVEKIDNLTESLEKEREELMDGDIIVFQKEGDNEMYELPTCQEYFKYLFYRVEVTFCDKTIPNDPGFTMELSLKMTYDQMAKAVAQRIGTDPYLLQFFKCQNYKDSSSHLKCTFEGTLREMVSHCKPKVKKLFYQQLSIRVNELENRKRFKCIWVGPSLKEEKVIKLYPNKNGTVATLLEEAKKQVELSENGSGKLRISEINCNKLLPGPGDDVLLDNLNSSGTKLYRIEEIPNDELHLGEDEMLVPVAHFHKDVFSTFGVPFFFKIKNGEPFPKMKDRLLKKLGVQEKEFEKFKFAVVTKGKPWFIIDSPDYCIKVDDFLPRFSNQRTSPCRPWLGLEHVNKVPKRSRINYLEKAVKAPRYMI